MFIYLCLFIYYVLYIYVVAMFIYVVIASETSPFSLSNQALNQKGLLLWLWG